jgi:hypothetical protein
MAVTILAAMRYFLHTKTEKLAGFAREVFRTDEACGVKAAQAGIDGMAAWFGKIGAPVTLAQAGITDPDAIAKMVPDALETAKAWGLAGLYTAASVENMFELCL